MYEPQKQALNSKVIKQIREKLNISQEKMADTLDMDRARLSKIERGLETPEWLKKFAQLSKMLHQAGMTWEDVVIEFPEPMAREKPGEYIVNE
jgi:transcriptional regulator with XRE-family HTH domain